MLAHVSLHCDDFIFQECSAVLARRKAESSGLALVRWCQLPVVGEYLQRIIFLACVLFLDFCLTVHS